MQAYLETLLQILQQYSDFIRRGCYAANIPHFTHTPV